METLKENIGQLAEFISDHKSDIAAMVNDKEMSAYDAAQKLLMVQFQLSQIEASEIVSSLNDGISTFRAKYEEALKAGKVNVANTLKDITKNLDDEETVKSYASILTALEVAGANFTDEEIQKTLEINSKKTIEELISELENKVNSGFNLDTIASIVNAEASLNVVKEMAEIIEINKVDFQLIAATWAYVAQREGKLRLTNSEVPLSPELLGELTCAGTEIILTTNELKSGKIDLKRWQEILKLILGTLIVIALSLIVGVTLMILFGGFFATVLEVLGGGLIATFVTIAIMFAIAGGTVNLLDPVFSTILKFLSNLYDNYIGVVTEKVKSIVAKIKEMVVHSMQTIKDKSGELKDKASQTASTAITDPEVPSADPIVEPVVQPVIQPAKA